MTINPESIELRIENAREKLYRMERVYGGVWHNKVIKHSMALDELINKFNRSKTIVQKEKKSIARTIDCGRELLPGNSLLYSSILLICRNTNYSFHLRFTKPTYTLAAADEEKQKEFIEERFPMLKKDT